MHHMTEPVDRNRGGQAADLDFYLRFKDKLRTRIFCAVPIENRDYLTKLM